MRRIERDERSSRVIAAEGPRRFRARGDVAPRKSDRVHNGSRENIVVGHDRRRATPRASTTRRDDERPTRGARGVVTLANRAGAFVAGDRSADGREPCDRGGTAGRRRGPETSSSGWDPRRRRARWWRAAVARARRRCRRSHEREWTPSGMPCAKCSSCRWSSAMDVLPIVGGKARGFEQSGNTLHQDRRENHSQLFYDWIPIREIFPPNHRVLRQRAPNCPVLSDVSAVGGDVGLGWHAFFFIGSLCLTRGAPTARHARCGLHKRGRG